MIVIRDEEELIGDEGCDEIGYARQWVSVVKADISVLAVNR